MTGGPAAAKACSILYAKKLNKLYVVLIRGGLSRQRCPWETASVLLKFAVTVTAEFVVRLLQPARTCITWSVRGAKKKSLQMAPECTTA